MTDEELDTRFDFAKTLITEAGAKALAYFNDLSSLTIKSKGVQDMASEADLEVELLIRHKLLEAFPEDGFIGEETGQDDVQGRDVIWVVDPIDGTQPFISGMAGWCVSIALVAAGTLQMGMVYAPVRGELFSGSRRHLAKLNDQPIKVRDAATVTEGITGVGYSPRVKPSDFIPVLSRLLEAGGMFYREGSGALTLTYVACGRLIGYVESHINSWDCLGAIAVVQAAGGTVNDFLANDGLWHGNSIAAGGPRLQPVLAGMLRQTEHKVS